MMSDSRILATMIRCTINTFSEPRNRRELASVLRRVRNTSGAKAGRLALAEISARWITNYVK